MCSVSYFCFLLQPTPCRFEYIAQFLSVSLALSATMLRFWLRETPLLSGFGRTHRSFAFICWAIVDLSFLFSFSVVFLLYSVFFLLFNVLFLLHRLCISNNEIVHEQRIFFDWFIFYRLILPFDIIYFSQRFDGRFFFLNRRKKLEI